MAGDGEDALPWVSHAALAVLCSRDGSSTLKQKSSSLMGLNTFKHTSMYNTTNHPGAGASLLPFRMVPTHNVTSGIWQGFAMGIPRYAEKYIKLVFPSQFLRSWHC